MPSTTPTFYLTGQNNFGNRGCEALVRSTLTVLNAAFGPVKILVPSFDPVRDGAQWPGAAAEGVEFVSTPSMPTLFAKWSGASQRFPLLQKLPNPRPALPASLLADLKRADVLLSIGGDNYSLDYGLASLFFFAGIADAAMAMGKPAVLWGASVGPFTREPLAEKRIAEHLRRLTLVTVRESRSIEYLRGIGVADNVLAVADSALAMKPQPVDTRAWWPADPGDGVLGLNIGWLIDSLRRQAGQAEGIVGEVVAFVREVLATTRLSVVLVPHVAPLNGNAFNNDEVFNEQLLAALGGPSARLATVPRGLNAAQLKHVISQCRLLIAARTHATIAAFSTAVPTLSIAYSVKAKGINRDLFGHERYVLETPKVARDTLRTGLELLLREEASIRDLYRAQLPNWRERAHAGAFELARRLSAQRS